MNPVYIAWLIDFEFGQQKDYLKVLSSSLEDYEEKLENQYSIEDLTDMSVEEEERYDKYLDIFSSVIGDFPRRLYTAFLVTWYAFMEDALSQLCDDLGLCVALRFQDKDGFGSGVLRAKRFLSEAGEINLRKSDWDELDCIRKIRNQIVHNGGKFEYSIEKPTSGTQAISTTINENIVYLRIEKGLYKYLKRNLILGCYGTFFINPSLEYCNKLVSFGESFFSSLLMELELI